MENSQGDSMAKIVEINSSHEIKNEVLHERYLKGKSPKTRDFIVSLDGTEAGLLIYEDWGKPEGFIFEIFVLKMFRKHGIGSWILSEAERIAADLSHAKIRLDARSLDLDEQSHEELATWYQRKGYIRVNIEIGTLEKTL